MARPYRLSVRTAPFQGAETGSIPVGATRRPGGAGCEIGDVRCEGKAQAAGRVRSSVTSRLQGL